MLVLILEILNDIGRKLILKTKVKNGALVLLADFPGFMKKTTQNLSSNFCLVRVRALI
jgi:hypothetical protein